MSVRRHALASLLFVGLAAGACHTTNRVPFPASDPPSAQAVDRSVLHPNDELKFRTSDGKRHRIKVAAIESDAIVSTGGQRFPVADITSIEKVTLAKGRTIALVTVAGLLVCFVIMASQVRFLPGS